MDTIRRQSIIWRVLPIVVVAVLMLLVINDYATRQRRLTIERAEYAADQIAENVASEIAATIGYAASSIRAVSTSIATGMTSEELTDPHAVIDPLLAATPFEAIEYIRADGMNMMTVGEPFDASDRVYYKEGIKGHTGIWNNHHPKYSKETLVNFYTPLIYEGKIVGVITGYISANAQLVAFLENDFFGEPVVGLLYDGDDMVICSTVAETFVKDLTLDKAFAGKGFTKEQLDDLLTKLKSGPCETAVFEASTGEGRLSISSIKGTDWHVAIIIRPPSFQVVAYESSQNATRMIVLITLILVISFASVSCASAGSGKPSGCAMRRWRKKTGGSMRPITGLLK
ncbi:MAG: hypothetical protein Q4B73_06115 [Lachnospiraceae bacterium]|nr:hypothetical protein [Lachnospiraceae bacterium]